MSNAGNVVAVTAANWQVYGLTHSSLAVGLLTLSEQSVPGAGEHRAGPGNVAAGAVAQLFSPVLSVVSGGLACVAGALLLGVTIRAMRTATLDERGNAGRNEAAGGAEAKDGGGAAA